MAEFLIVRHGQDVQKSEELRYIHGSIDTPLAYTGIMQSERVANELAPYDICAVHAPPLRRTLGTARSICRTVGSRLIIDETLVGRDMGRFALGGHKSMAEAASDVIVNAQGVAYYVHVPGAESLDTYYERVRTAYLGLSEEYADQVTPVVLVTQHFAGTLLRGIHDSLSLEEAVEYGDLSHTGIAKLAPGQLSVEL